MLPQSLRKLTVLYVEDEVLIAMDGEETLRALGLESISVAMSFKDAQAAMSCDRFDLALLDINLGGGQTSLALADALHADGTKIIFVSGYTGSDGLKTRLNAPLVGKPFDEEALAAAIQMVLTSR